MTTAGATKARPIPGSHLDLARPVHAVLTTMGPDGQPQSTLVWADVQDGAAAVNTTLKRQKGRNMAANPKVSLLVVDPGNTSRYIQIRGDEQADFRVRDHVAGLLPLKRGVDDRSPALHIDPDQA